MIIVSVIKLIIENSKSFPLTSSQVLTTFSLLASMPVTSLPGCDHINRRLARPVPSATYSIKSIHAAMGRGEYNNGPFYNNNFSYFTYSICLCTHEVIITSQHPSDFLQFFLVQETSSKWRNIDYLWDRDTGLFTKIIKIALPFRKWLTY